MAMESNDNLTSYLKSMFVQFHGEEQLPPPPPQAPSSAPAPVASSSQSTASETASTSSMAVEGTTSEPLTNYEEETDVNNNSESPTKNASPLKLMTNGNSTIEVNVDVHHSDNDSIDANRGESSGSEEVTLIEAESPQPVQTTLAHNKIALTFLDELKQTLQSNEGNDAPTTEQAVHPIEQSLVVQTDSGSSADRRKEEEEKTPSLPPPQPAIRAIEASSSSSSSVAEEATSSTAESGIQEDIDDAVFSGQGSSTASTPTLESDIVSSPPSSSSSNRLVRSASSNVFSSSSSSQSNGGPPSTSGRRVLRSVSQDVRFKLESIKEEKKVTKAHVSELANFWKGKMISPKDKS